MKRNISRYVELLIRSIAFACFASILSSCAETENNRQIQIPSANTSSQMSVSLFSRARSIRALDLNNIFAEVTADGSTQTRSEGDEFTLTFDNIPQGSTFSLQIDWFENFQGEAILLGSFSTSQVISEDTNISVDDSRYTTKGQQGDRFDFDNDGFSNLEEREMDSNPLDPNSTPVTGATVDVSISFFNVFESGNTGQLDLDKMTANVFINGRLEAFAVFPDTDYVSTAEITSGSDLEVRIEWLVDVDPGTPADNSDDVLLLVGSYTYNESTVESNRNLVVDIADYNTVLDSDGDGAFNLDELIDGSDPFDENSPGGTQVTPSLVSIKAIDPANAPVIDGLYESAWDGARFTDIDGNPMSIDNLMIDQGALRPDGQEDGNRKMRWYAMHDFAFLYIFVEAENVNTANPVRDSGSEVWLDDNLEIFIDANNSRGQSYDGVDDRHFQMPLLTSAEDPFSNSTIFVTGPNSAPLPAFSFSSCRCTQGQHTWEIAIPMVDFGIQFADTTFGLDIQIDLDHDGGDRDAKWGWYHPSRIDTDVDNTFTNPSFMGFVEVSSGG